MPRTRLYIRSMLALLLVAACFAAMIFPLLDRAQAAPEASRNQVSAPPGDLVISAFRFSGPGGPGDEYIELFNRSCSPTGSIDLQNYTFKFSDANTFTPLLVTFSGGSVIQPRGYFLLGLAGINGYVGPPATDATYIAGALSTPPPTTGIPAGTGGVAVFAPGGPSIAVDAVGVNSDGYFETSPINATSSNQTFVRIMSGGIVDTNDNEADFVPNNSYTPHNFFSPAGTCGIPTQTISGNTGVGGVTLSYRDIDNTLKSITSDASGDYSITVPSNWSGTITPSLPGYTFSPPSRQYTGLLSDKTGQDFAASQGTPSPRDVVINEISWSGTSSAPGDQWIELYNTRSYAVDISGWTLSDTEASMGTDGVLTFSKADSPDGKTKPVIAAHGFFVIASNKNVFKGLTADYYDPNLSLPACSQITDCGDRLSLNLPPPFTGILGETIDTANYYSYHWLAGSMSGHRSMERGGPSGPVGDSYTAWLTYIGSPPSPSCPAHPDVRDRTNNKINGTPGCPNWASIVTPTPIPTSTPYRYKTPTPRPPTPYGHMVINEFLPRAGYDYNQDGTVDVYDEFVELKNLGPVAAQLNGWKIDVISPGGPSSYPLSGITLQPDQRVLFYSLKSHLSLYDSGGTVRLINNRGIVVDARSYGPVQNADQSTCRIPDGYYWQFPCFPTPGLENSLTGTLPVPPPVIASQPPPCLLADTVPDPFKQAECNGFGADVINPAYWDNQSGFNSYPVPDVIDKNGSEVK